MVTFVARRWLLAASVTAALAAAPAFAAKDVVVAVGSNFTTLDPYDANDTLSQAVAKSFYQGLFGLDNEMKLKNVLAQGYTVSDDGQNHAESAILGVYQYTGAPGNGDDLACRVEKVRQGDWLPPGRYRPVRAAHLEPDRFCEGEEIPRVLAERAAEAGHHHLASGGG